MKELSLLNGIEYILKISLLITLRINHFLSLIMQGIPNCLPKIVFSLSAEHASRVGHIISRIILNVDVVGFIDEEDICISEMTRASFG